MRSSAARIVALNHGRFKIDRKNCSGKRDSNERNGTVEERSPNIYSSSRASAYGRVSATTSERAESAEKRRTTNTAGVSD